MTEMKNFIQSALILTAVLMSTTGAQTVVYAQVGDTVTLSAPDVNNVGNTYLKWYHNDDQIAWRNHLGGKGVETEKIWKNRLSLSGNSLVIKNITEQHFVTLTCKVTSGTTDVGTTTIRLLKLTVTGKPSHILLRGETLSLRCSTDNPQGIKKPEIYWLNPQGEKMKNEGTVREQVTDKHNGLWTCVVAHDNKRQTVEIPVDVFAEFSPEPSSVFTSVSSPLTIPCTFPDHISWEKINTRGIQAVEWHFSPTRPDQTNHPQELFSLSMETLIWNPHTVKNLTAVRHPQKNGLSLTSKQCTEGNRGDYTCTIEFKDRMAVNRIVHVDVLEIKSSPGMDLISGQQVNLTCLLGRPLPSDLRVEWFPPKDSALTPDRHSTHLTIPEVGTGDSGKWRCELWRNTTMLTSAEITLKIERKLNVWMLLIIGGVAVIVILLVVLFFICRRRQRKMRHPRHRLCQCKNPKPKGFYRT